MMNFKIFPLLFPLLSWALFTLPIPARGQESPIVSYPLGEVVVTGTRTPRTLIESPFATSVITQVEIRRFGWTTLEEALKEIPGLVTQVSQSGVYSVNIQGFRDNKVLVLVDGMPVNSKVRNRVDLSLIPLQNVERIEIVRGPQSTLYGSDAIAGVIHIITRSPEKPQFSLYSRGGTPAQQEHFISYTLTSKKWKALLSYDRRSSDGIDLHPADPALDSPEFRKNNYSIKIQVPLSPTSSITLQDDYFTNYSKFFLWSASQQRKTSWGFWDRRSTQQLRYQFTTKRGSRLQFFAFSNPFYHSFTEIRPPRPATRSDIRDRYQRYEVQYDYPLTEAHLLTVGADSIQDRYTSDRISPKTQTVRLQEGYLQGQWQFARTWEGVYGFRWTDHSRFGGEGIPRAGLVKHFSPRFRAKLSAGKGFRSPEPTELFQDFLIPTGPASSIRILGNPDLSPETSKNYQLTLESGPHGRSFYRLNGFYNRVNDLILFIKQDDPNTPDVEEWRYQNVESARVQGVEWEGQYQFSSTFSIQAGGVFQNARNLTTGRTLEFTPDAQANVRLLFQNPRYFSSVRFTYVGTQQFGISTESTGSPPGKVKQYTLMDVEFTIPLDGYRIFLGVNNAIGVERPPFGPSQGRIFYAGYDVNW